MSSQVRFPRGLQVHLRPPSYLLGRWGLMQRFFFPVVSAGGGRGGVPLVCFTHDGHPAVAFACCRAAPHVYDAHLSSRGLLSQSLAGTTVDEIMLIGFWKTIVTDCYIDATTSSRVVGANSKRVEYAGASDAPSSPDFDAALWACSRTCS